jgi:4-hydroxy-3-methylbut-2-enyl diphosphate reductase IspH
VEALRNLIPDSDAVVVVSGTSTPDRVIDEVRAWFEELPTPQNSLAC